MTITKALRASVIIGAGVFAGQGAFASDWGCEVLLCLSNPGGPTEFDQCKPPIHKLWDHLRKGRSFPSCDMAGDSKSGRGSFARQTYTHYDPCPTGTRALDAGLSAARQADVSSRRVGWGWGGLSEGSVYRGIGEGEGLTGSWDSPLGNKVCVGNLTGRTYVGSGGDSYTEVLLFDQVVELAPHRSPRAIDIYIDGALYKRVHW